MKIFDSYRNKSWKGSNFLKNKNFLKISKNGLLSHSISIPSGDFLIKIYGRKKTGNGKFSISVKNKNGNNLLQEEIIFESSNLSEKIFYFKGDGLLSNLRITRPPGSFGSIEINRIIIESSSKKILTSSYKKQYKKISIDNNMYFKKPNIRLTPSYEKVGIIIPYSIYGGAEEYLVNFINYSNMNNLFIITKSNNKIISRIKNNNKIIEYKNLNELSASIKSNKFEAILFYNSLNIYNMLINLDLKIDLIEIYHSDFIWPDAIAKINNRLGVKKIAKVSNSLLQTLNTDAKIITLPVSIDFNKFNFLNKNIKENKNIIGTVARLSDEKNIDYILDLAKKDSDFNYIIIGDGPKRNYLLNRKNNEKINNVEFLGYKSDVEEYYKIMNGFLLPSKIEGTPFSIIEAMAMKIPVFATKVGAIPDLLQKQRGFYINNDYDKTINLIKNNLNNKRIIEKAFNYVNENHNISKNIKIFEKLLSPNDGKFIRKNVNKENILVGRFI